MAKIKNQNPDYSQLLQEIAGEVSDNKFASLLSLLPNPDRVLEKSGETHKVYLDILTDPHVISVVMSRRNGLLSNEWRISPPSHTSGQEFLAKKAEDLVKENFERLKINDLIGQILKAPLYGSCFGELLWLKDGDTYIIEKIKDRPLRRLAFTPGGEMRILTKEKPTDGIPAEPNKFYLSRHMPDAENPYGVALLSSIFWPYTFKHTSQKFWLTFLEKYGSPFLTLKFPENTKKEEIAAAVADAKKAVRDAAIGIKNNESVDLLESKGKSGESIHERLCGFSNREISKVILGQTLSTETSDKGGSYAAAKAHLDVRSDIIDADKRLVTEVINRDIIAPIVRINLGYNAPLPQFEFYQEEEPRKDWAEVFTEVDKVKEQIPIPKTFFYNKLNLPLPEKGEDVIVLGGGQNTEAGGRSQFAVHSSQSKTVNREPSTVNRFSKEQQQIENLADGEIPKLSAALGKNEKKIQEEINNADSYESAFENILNLYPKMEIKDVEKIIHNGMLNAEAFGKYTVVTGQ